MDLSIIIINYKVKEKLFACIESIYSSKPKVKFEVIVVDNDEIKSLEKDLLIKFPKIIYVKSPKNLGFGAGNNLGAKSATGEYLFFLNPDTKVSDGTIDNLSNFLNKNKGVGIAAPLLIDEKGSPFKRQGSQRLDMFNGFFSLSFLGKIFPGPAKDFYLENWNKKTNKEVDVAPGTGFMITKELFREIGGFDEKFFLYFEENDICNRVKDLGYKIYILSGAKIYHEVGASTSQYPAAENEFKKSRFLYFKKYCGLPSSLIIEFFLRINRYVLLIVLILVLTFLFRIYNLSQSMSFIGDEGWFYLSARDMLLTGKIPLVGITSSHTWLHQGPLWTYLLAIVLYISKFNPISGGYLTALFGVLTTFLIYKLGTNMFSRKVGIVASTLYFCSPLVLLSDRIPFHPAPIPFFGILYLYAIYKWINGNIKYFPVILFSLAVLYNLELATFILVFPLIMIGLYGLFKKTLWIKKVIDKKIILFSFISFLIPLLPVIVYDVSNGFHQTIIFLLWIVYKPISGLIKHSASIDFKIMIDYFGFNLQRLIFGVNEGIALVIFVVSLIIILSAVLKKNFRVFDSKTLLFIFVFFSYAGIFISGTPSGAYLPIIFIPTIYLIALATEFLINQKSTKYLGILILVIILCGNIYADREIVFGHEFQDRLKATEKIIGLAQGGKYNLIGKGPNSQFESFTMNYEYLLWWKGSPPSHIPERTIIIVREENGMILVTKE